MVVVAVVCLVAAVALGIALARTRTRLADLEVALRTTIGERDALEGSLAAAHDDLASAVQDRDDAAARVQRARRDAADVAARLRDEAEARAAAEDERAALERGHRALERELDEARSQIDQRVAELEEIRARPAAASGTDVPSELLWALALERSARTWRTSISLGLDEPSPLADSTNPLRTAIEIEIDAAREEAGADIELHWTGDDHVPAASAVVVLSLVEAVIAAVAKTAASSTLSVDVLADAVEVRFEAVDEHGRRIPLDVPGVDPQVPGRAVVPVTVAER